jgi:hypothetical protein
MTEAEWMACPHPTPMLDFLQGRVSNRKLQLFACACCRRLLGLFPNAAMRQAVEFSEQDADQLASPEQWIQAEQAVASWLDAPSTLHGRGECTQGEASAVRTVHGLTQRRPLARSSLARYAARDARRAVYEAANDRRAIQRAAPQDVVRVARATWQAAQTAYESERQAQAALLREIIGNPFHPVVPDPAWQRPEVAVFAELIDERQAFERLSELGELLEEVGCVEGSLLAHCRAGGDHVRGCWLVDLILGNR